MTGRKRANPQRLGIENDSKRQELSFCQYIPREKPTELTDGESSQTCPLSDIENTSDQTAQVKAPTTNRKTGRSKKRYNTSYKNPVSIRMLPTPPTFAEGTLASLHVAQPPRVPYPYKYSIPLFHPYQPGLEAYDIRLSREGHGAGVCISIGEMVVQLEHGLPLNKLYSECGVSLKLSLVVSEYQRDHVMLRLGDGNQDVYLDVQLISPSFKADRDIKKLLSQSRCVRLAIRPISEDVPVVNELVIDAWAMETLCETNGPSETLKWTGNVSGIKALVELLHPGCLDDLKYGPIGHSDLSVSAKINKFYKDVKDQRESDDQTPPTPLDPSSIPGLSAELREYQCKAVGWMLGREGGGGCEGGVKSGDGVMSDSGEEPLHKLWRKLPTVDQVYFNPYSGKFSKKCFPVSPWPRGGILADEMGLGKTVEILALILAHTWTGTDSNTSEPNEVDLEPSCVESTDGRMEGACVLVPSTELVVDAMPSRLSEAKATITDAGDIVRQADLSTDSPELTPSLGNFNPSSANNRHSSPTLKEPPKTSSTCKEVDQTSDVIQCLCGATSESGYDGEFVQCERCMVWQHSSCADYCSEKHGEHFYCVKCLLEEPLPSGATLIISPQAIAQQWMDEIHKHTQPGAVKTHMYEGVSQKRFTSPLELSRYDIVMVTYETLRTEFYHATSQEMSKTLRNRKRYSCFPSPLPAVHWWRVCLDEAQMVETTNVRSAEMTKKLTAVNRWCVTGTPVQKQLLDLYGLLLFLNVDPYCHSPWFSKLVWEPYLHGNDYPIVDLFAQVMWRNSKADVASELCLPAHTEEVHWLSFNSVEAYFYERQQETCYSDLNQVVYGLRYNSTLSSLLQTTFNKLMVPLHSLRQACCHPQIVKSGSYLPVSVTNKTYITMPRLLEKLTSQAKVEAREALRQLVAALNGLAGVHVLQQEWALAVRYYRDAMATWEGHLSHDVDCDKLPRIHTMENLAELLGAGHGEEDHTLKDDQLVKEASTLRSKYTEKVEGHVRVAAESLVVCKENIERALRESNWSLAEYLGEIPPELVAVTLQSNLAQSSVSDEQNLDDSNTSQNHMETDEDQRSNDTIDQSDKIQPDGDQSDDVEGQRSDAMDQSEADGCGISDKDDTLSRKEKLKETLKPIVHPSQPWWVSVCAWSSGLLLEDELLLAVKVDCEGMDSVIATEPRFVDLTGLSYFIADHADKVQSSRQYVLSLINELSAPPTSELVDHASNCHLCLTRRDDPEEVEADIQMCPICVAETKIVPYGSHLYSQYTDGEGGMGQGSRKPGLLERILRSVVGFARLKKGPSKLVEAGQAFLSYIDHLKKEYIAIRAMWVSLGQRLSAYDELNMASTRLRFMTTTEIIIGRDIPSAVDPFQVFYKIDQLKSDKVSAERDLKKCLGQVLYLKNLAKMMDKNGSNSEPCPVCTQQFDREWAVFSCGHPLCVECTSALICNQPRHYYQSSVTVKCPLCREPSISSDINYIRDNVDENERIQIQGCHSTKIAAVTRTLLHIQQTDPEAKCLVFSSWMEVLDLIGRALVENRMQYRFLKTKKAFQVNLTEFKTSPDINILLLPFHSGSKGLNIVEASHVLLVEPLLNLGAELQAIGRVHRMGQTRPTTVHRFLVNQTVEEKIFSLFNSRLDRDKFVSSHDRESELTLSDIQSLFDI